MAAADGVGTKEGDNLTVVEAHAVKDLANVLLLLAGVWETTVGGTGGNVLVSTAGTPWDDWASNLLNGADGGEGPEVRVSDP